MWITVEQMEEAIEAKKVLVERARLKTVDVETKVEQREAKRVRLESQIRTAENVIAEAKAAIAVQENKIARKREELAGLDTDVNKNDVDRFKKLERELRAMMVAMELIEHYEQEAAKAKDEVGRKWARQAVQTQMKKFRAAKGPGIRNG